MQFPLEQPASPGHTRPQPPQFNRSFVVSRHALEQQRPEPTNVPPSRWQTLPCSAGVQTSSPHLPLVHDSPLTQMRPQVPQLVRSVLRFTHALLQHCPVAPASRSAHDTGCVCPTHVSATHAPLVQVSPAPQTVPHRPQLR